MAQVLVGYDKTGSIMQFDADGDFVAGGRKINDAIFLNFSRLLTKDEIKKESFEMTIGVDDDNTTPFAKRLIIFDMSASNEYRVNSPAGEYGILYATSSAGGSNLLNVNYFGYDSARQVIPCGLIYYQAGVAVLTSSLFLKDDSSAANFGISSETNDIDMDDLTVGDQTFTTLLTTGEITASADAIRHRMFNLQFNNTTELNSTIYFCRANHNEFNYSANPTYLSGSKIRVKSETTDVPVSYITTVGLYNDRRELLAVAKLSEPLKKTPDSEFTLRVRLDY